MALNTGDNLDLEILHDLEKLTVLPLGKWARSPQVCREIEQFSH